MTNWCDNQLVECQCNLCGSRINKFIFSRPDNLRVVQCDACGLVYLNPRPKDDLIPTLYESNYFSSTSSIGFTDYFSDDMRCSMHTTSKRRLRVLEENGISTFGKTLEIGCATGEFCQAIHKMGADVTGIDISESAIEKARSRYKTIPFRVGTLDDVDSVVKYEALFAFEVIEHLTDPDKFFRKASELLEKEGFLCITTPSFECAESIGFDNWIGFTKSLEHLYFFSSAVIGKYAAKHGMQVTYTLYGEGKGLNNQPCNENKTKKMAKRVLNSIYLLGIIQSIKSVIQSTRPIKHDYQSDEIRHNLLMILRKT